MTDDLEQQLLELGFAKSGRFSPPTFALNRECRDRPSVYVWAERQGSALRPLRVGIAAGSGAMAARYTLYNRWLEGRFKPDDPREQHVRSLMLRKLTAFTEVWSVEVPDRETGLSLESRLRQRWGTALELDLVVRDSWIGREMKAWRASRTGISTATEPAKPKAKVPRRSAASGRADVTAKLGSCESWVRTEFARLHAAIEAVAPQVVEESGPGLRFAFGPGRWVCRLHPKQGHIAVGLPNSMRDYVRSLGVLRPQREAAWFNYDRTFAAAKVEQAITESLRRVAAG